MGRNERKMLKYNAGFVDTVFCLMFETLWVPPYDRRKRHPVLADFECNARRVSVLLGKLDLAAASAAELHELGESVDALMRSVARIADAELFPDDVCAEARELVGRIRDALPAQCGVAVK